MASIEEDRHPGPAAVAEDDRPARPMVEMAIGICCALAFAGFGLLSQQTRSAGLATVGIGPTFFPVGIAIVGTGLSLLYAVFALLRAWRGGLPQAPAELAEDTRQPFLAHRPLAILAAPVIWAAALPHLGFLLGTWAMMTLLIILFDPARVRAWVVAPLVLTTALWLIFEVALQVRLPPFALI